MFRRLTLLLACLGAAVSARLAAASTMTATTTKSMTVTMTWSPSSTPGSPGPSSTQTPSCTITPSVTPSPSATRTPTRTPTSTSTPGTPSPTWTPTQTPGTTALACTLVTDQAAQFCLGQVDLVSGQENQGLGSAAADRLNAAFGLAIGGGLLFVADANNNRVVGYPLSSIGQDAVATVFLGQTSASGSGNIAPPSSASLNSPQGIGCDGQHFAIADSNNNRVLVYNSIPTGMGQAADAVLGQATMSGSAFGAATAMSVGQPEAVAVADGRIFVADTANNRVLVYNLPVTNGQAASVVLGQSDFSGATLNRGGTRGANTLFKPSAVAVFGQRLYVSDFGNARVLVWNNDLSLSNGQAADLVLGQADFSSTGASQGAASLLQPAGIYSDGVQLFIANGADRVSIFNTLPVINGAPADEVLGQPDFASNLATTSATSTGGPQGMVGDGTHLFVAISGESRVMAFGCSGGLTASPPPTRSPTPAPPTFTPAPTPALSPVPTQLIANFNGGIADVANGGNVQMQASASNSTISQSAGPSSTLSGGTGSSLHLTGSIGRDDGTGVFAVAQISIFNGWTWAYIPPAAPDHALTFSYQADAISVGQQLRVSFQTGTDGLYSYVFTPTDTAWHQITVYFPDVSGPSFTPQLVASPGTPAWSVGVFDIRAILFDIVPSTTAAQSFGFSVDDIHLGEPQSNSSPAQIASALGVTVAQVNDAYSYNLDEQLTWIVLLLAKDCGCSPDQIMTLRQTMSWGDIAVAEGTTWAAVLAQQAAAGLSAPVMRVDEMNRGLLNGALPAYVPPTQLYVPATSYAPIPANQSCQ
jgi:hypothetical protein